MNDKPSRQSNPHHLPAGGLASINGPPVGMICGGGDLPLELAEKLSAGPREFHIVGIEKEATPDLKSFGAEFLPVTRLGSILRRLKQANCRDLILLGSINARPTLSEFLPNFRSWRLLARLRSMRRGGDDTILTRMIYLLEEDGFHVRAPQEFAPSFLAEEGALTNLLPGNEEMQDIALARKVLNKTGPFDIGQAAVAAGGRIIAIEAAEGTDAMIERCDALKNKRGIPPAKYGAVLVKSVKPNQDRRVDLPCIGPETVKRASAAKLAGIAVEAGSCLIARRNKTVEAANALGVFIYGFKASPLSPVEGERECQQSL